ncbi:hypothetical protein [Croceimicrobium sp.]|uniref:hypothetical protein n=1 Tax=Croceimicrobium sp. TaxID=2828340 RepID=UPI003BACDE3E
MERREEYQGYVPEIIKEIVINDKNELLVKLIGDANPMYQYLYREAAGVYWDEDLKAFKSTPLKEWTASKWFFHIKDLVSSVLKVELLVDEKIEWVNVAEDEVNKIKKAMKGYSNQIE